MDLGKWIENIRNKLKKQNRIDKTSNTATNT